MKQKPLVRVERRRPLVEVNLGLETKPPRSPIMRRRGCALFGPAAVVMAASAIALLGLR